MACGSTQHHRFRKISGPAEPRFDVLVVLVKGRHVLINGFGFVELPFSLEIKCEAV